VNAVDERGGQVTTGVRAVLSHPLVYEIWSSMLGGRGARRMLLRDHARPASGERVLDLGCGPGDLRLDLPAQISYVGVDLSEDYIARARERFGADSEFRAGDATSIDHDLGDFDLVLVVGVLHHLDDAQVLDLFAGASRALRPGGRAMTVDPTLTDGQSRAARAVITRDRGQHVRGPEAYAGLAARSFEEVVPTVREDLLRIPYTHCVLECRAPM
jgi:SAM-dependent methyltransferase